VLNTLHNEFNTKGKKMSNALAIYQDFNSLKNIATTLAQSDLIPPQFYKKPSNVIIALEFAHRNDIAPFQAMQSLFVVHGRVGMTAAMAISLANKAGVFKHLRYRESGEGENLSVTAVATLHDGTEVTSTVSLQTAKKAGWTKNAVYNSIPEQMLRYRAAVFLIRAHWPEVLFGMSTKEELEDVVAAKTNPEVIAKPDIKIIEATIEPEQPQPQSEPQRHVEVEISDSGEVESVGSENDFERDIEDYRSEVLGFLESCPIEWFQKIGKDKTSMLSAIEAEKDLEKMKVMYERVQKYDKLANM
jgi:hypothetical protein